MRADLDPDAAARIMIATFQGLVLQANWGEALDLAAVGRLMRRMIRGAFLTDAGRAASADAARRSSSHGHDRHHDVRAARRRAAARRAGSVRPRRRWFAALKALRRLLRDKEDTGQVFEIMARAERRLHRCATTRGCWRRRTADGLPTSTSSWRRS